MFQRPMATQNQIAAMSSAQIAWPHCAVGNETSVPTNVNLAIPRKTRVRQISKSPATPARMARIVTPMGRCM